MAEVKVGLQDVVIAQSRICSIDGQRDVLTYCGYDIHDLDEHATFEEVVYLLWHGELPKRAEIEELKKQLAENRPISSEIVDLMKRLPPAQHPMETLRTVVSALSLYDPEAEDMSLEANRHKAMRLTGQMGTIVAAYGRLARVRGVLPAALAGTILLTLLQGVPIAGAAVFLVLVVLGSGNAVLSGFGSATNWLPAHLPWRRSSAATVVPGT